VIKEFEARSCGTDRYELGECCRWDGIRNELYWVDIPTGRFFRARANREHIEIVRSYQVDGVLTAVAPMQDRKDGWIIASDQSISILDPAGDVRRVAQLDFYDSPHVRTNDGAADPWGRFWVGSMDNDPTERRAGLYRFHRYFEALLIFGDVSCSNGLGWSPDQRTMYYVDSQPGTIHTFDVELNGEISNKQLFAHFDIENDGLPDGLCVDSDGAIWVALWGGSQVRRYSPFGEQLAVVTLSTAQPSSCAIGGANGTTLYITTAREGLPRETLQFDEDAGRLFCVDVGVSGLQIDACRIEGLPVKR